MGLPLPRVDIELPGQAKTLPQAQQPSWWSVSIGKYLMNPDGNYSQIIWDIRIRVGSISRACHRSILYSNSCRERFSEFCLGTRLRDPQDSASPLQTSNHFNSYIKLGHLWPSSASMKYWWGLLKGFTWTMIKWYRFWNALENYEILWMSMKPFESLQKITQKSAQKSVRFWNSQKGSDSIPGGSQINITGMI